jgi:hypothetical protein
VLFDAGQIFGNAVHEQSLIQKPWLREFGFLEVAAKLMAHRLAQSLPIRARGAVYRFIRGRNGRAAGYSSPPGDGGACHSVRAGSGQ